MIVIGKPYSTKYSKASYTFRNNTAMIRAQEPNQSMETNPCAYGNFGHMH